MIRSQGLRYAEWDVAKLVLLPKKGDLSLCKNLRGIAMPIRRDVVSKIFSSLLVRRMQIVMEEGGIEEQAGFRQLRGTIDGLSSTRIWLQVTETQLRTISMWKHWRCLLTSSSKAFDSESREALFAVLRQLKTIQIVEEVRMILTFKF